LIGRKITKLTVWQKLELIFMFLFLCVVLTAYYLVGAITETNEPSFDKVIIACKCIESETGDRE